MHSFLPAPLASPPHRRAHHTEPAQPNSLPKLLSPVICGEAAAADSQQPSLQCTAPCLRVFLCSAITRRTDPAPSPRTSVSMTPWHLIRLPPICGAPYAPTHLSPGTEVPPLPHSLRHQRTCLSSPTNTFLRRSASLTATPHLGTAPAALSSWYASSTGPAYSMRCEGEGRMDLSGLPRRCYDWGSD